MNEMNGLDWVNGMKETLDVRREINSLEINRGYAYLIEMILLHCTLIASWHSIFHVQHTTSQHTKYIHYCVAGIRDIIIGCSMVPE